jgi:chromate transport protein ChrA
MGSIAEVFGVALKLGLTSFGGPIADLGYFERTYVRERRWLSGADYAGIVGLCQLLPGPSSSQVGFLIGYHKAGFGCSLPDSLAQVSSMYSAHQRREAISHGGVTRAGGAF